MPGFPSRRLFLALWPDAGTRHEIERQVCGWRLPAGSRPVDRADWHLTLHFIGGVRLDRVPDLESALGVAVDRFEVVLDEPQIWPRGLAVLRARDIPPGLTLLHQRLARRLLALGETVDSRPYRPHLTLARRAAGAVPPVAGIEPIRWPVSGYSLVESAGHPGVRYRIVRSYA